MTKKLNKIKPRSVLAFGCPIREENTKYLVVFCHYCGLRKGILREFEKFWRSLE